MRRFQHLHCVAGPLGRVRRPGHTAPALVGRSCGSSSTASVSWSAVAAGCSARCDRAATRPPRRVVPDGTGGPLVFHMVIAPVVLGYYWVMWMPLFLALVALGVGELIGNSRE